MIFQIFFFVFLSQLIYGQNLQDGYHFTRERMNYDAAVKYCAGLEMKLPVIDDEATSKLVNDIAIKNSLGTYWINANDINYETDWVSSDGEFLKYKPFHQVEPNGGHNENCVHGLFYPNGLWNDISCTGTNAVICDPGTKEKRRR